MKWPRQLESEGTSSEKKSYCKASGRANGYIEKDELGRRRCWNGCCLLEVQLRCGKGKSEGEVARVESERPQSVSKQDLHDGLDGSQPALGEPIKGLKYRWLVQMWG